MKRVHEAARDVPVLLETDVVVAGAGIAGIFAALSAARHGARVALIDRYGSTGGNYGPGLGARHDLWQQPSQYARGLGGAAGAFLARLEQMGGLTSFAFTGGGDFRDWSWKDMPPLPVIDNQAFEYLVLQWCDEAGIQLLLSTDVAGAVLVPGQDAGIPTRVAVGASIGNPVAASLGPSDGMSASLPNVGGVLLETKAERQAVLSRVVVDCTGDADIAAAAGAPTVDTFALRSPSIGLFFRTGGVDWDRYEAFRRAAKAQPLPPDLDQWRVDVFEKALGYHWPNDPHDLMPAIRAAWERGEYRYVQPAGDLTSVYMVPFGTHNQAVTTVEMTATPRVDPTNVLHRSLLESKFRRYIYETVQFLVRYAPGFEQATIEQIAPFMGTRYSRTIDPEHAVTREDIASGRRFDDVVHRMSLYDRRAGGLVDFSRGEEGASYELPYRALLPKGADGLLAAGRTVNVELASRLRARWMVMLTGAIAGMAAALSAREQISPRALPVRRLQRALLNDGFYLGDGDRLAELNLADAEPTITPSTPG